MRLQARMTLFGLLLFVLVGGALVGLAVWLDPKDERRERETVDAALRQLETVKSLRDIDDRLEALEADGFLGAVHIDGAEVSSTFGDERNACRHRRRHHHGRPPHRGPRGLRPPPFLGGDRPPPRCVRKEVEASIDGATTTLHVEVQPPRPPPEPPVGAALLGVTLVLLAGLAFAFSRSLVRPLRKLADAADAMAVGALDTRVELDRSDEIGDVARAFNQMSAHVERMVRSEKELLASVSHELRTPLARLQVGLELLHGEAASEAVAALQGDVQELAELVERLLYSAQLDAGTHQGGALPRAQLERISIVDVVEHAATQFRRAHPQRDLIVDVDGRCRVLGDKKLLASALGNLLDNADKYTPDGAQPITLSTRNNAEAVELVVEDRGIGVAGEDMTQLVQPFSRGRDAKQRGIRGTGLGLSLVRHIADTHGGVLELRRREVGTAAVLRLPTIGDDQG